jgi:hypothetical protein
MTEATGVPAARKNVWSQSYEVLFASAIRLDACHTWQQICNTLYLCTEGGLQLRARRFW